MNLGDETRQLLARRPLKNFVFFPAIQWPQIVRNCLLASASSVATGGGVLLLYLWRYGGIELYVRSSDGFLGLESHNALELVLPAVIGTSVCGMLLGWWLALVASRRIALPIFKAIQWARQVAEGNLRACLSFRTGDRLQELSEACESGLANVRQGYEELAQLERDPSVPPEIRQRINRILAPYRF